jgi:hypothetical protein
MECSQTAIFAYAQNCTRRPLIAGPIDAVTAIHNAFRNDITAIDEAAFAPARGEGDLSKVVERYSLLTRF